VYMLFFESKVEKRAVAQKAMENGEIIEEKQEQEE